MHRVDSRTYVGHPNETVTLTTQTNGGGQVQVVVDGRDIGAARQFPLSGGAGDRVKFQVSLMGPLGASCVVGIATVDGGSDGDFLMCQAHNPAPVTFYTASVVGATSLRALTKARGLTPAPVVAAVPKKRAKKAAKKGGGR